MKLDVMPMDNQFHPKFLFDIVKPQESKEFDKLQNNSKSIITAIAWRDENKLRQQYSINMIICKDRLIQRSELYFNGEDINPLSQWNILCPSKKHNCNKFLRRKRNNRYCRLSGNCTICNQSLKNEFNVFSCPNIDQCQMNLCEMCYSQLFVRIDSVPA